MATTDPEIMRRVLCFWYIPDVSTEPIVGSCGAPVREIASDIRDPPNPSNILTITKALKMAVPIFYIPVSSPSSNRGGAVIPMTG